MDLKEFQDSQQGFLYNQGKFHESHDMFIDLDDMWRGCLACKTTNHEKLGQPCKESVNDS